MEPSQWDKKIKDLLEQRTLQPSDGAWEKLSAGLSSKSGKRFIAYRRYGMAAAIAGLILLSALFIRTNGKPVQQQVQGSKMEEKLDAEIDKQELLATPGEHLALPMGTVTEKEHAEGSLSTEGTATFPAEPPLATTVTPVQVASAGTDVQRPDIDLTEEQLIQAKIDELIAQVNSREMEEGALAESEVDSLLRAAQQEILLKRQVHATQSVDAMVLLTEVETELDRSFRDQLFERLKAGYIKVRTAIADRNH